MANLLDPPTGDIHATAIDGSWRALCNLAVAAPPNWMLLDYSRVTCENCRLRIDRTEDEARGGYDPSGHLDHRAVQAANVLRREVATAGGIYESMSFADITALFAEAFFPDDEERQVDFCHWALDPYPPRDGHA